MSRILRRQFLKAVPLILPGLLVFKAGDRSIVAAAEVAGWHSLFDGKGLGDWKLTDYAGKGEVEVKDGQLILNAGGDLTGVNLEKAPVMMDYEVEFTAMRVQGDDFFVGFTFAVGAKHVTFIAGGWSGTVTGISNVNGDSAIENETVQFKKFDNGKWYHVRVKVTPAKIEVWMDKEQVVNLETEGKELSVRAGEIEISKPFGFSSWRTKAALKDIRWRKLAAAAK